MKRILIILATAIAVAAHGFDFLGYMVSNGQLGPSFFTNGVTYNPTNGWATFDLPNSGAASITAVNSASNVLATAMQATNALGLSLTTNMVSGSTNAMASLVVLTNAITGATNGMISGAGLTSASNSLVSSITGATNGLGTVFQTKLAAGTTNQYYDATLALRTFPAIPAAQIQSDWTQGSSGALDYIKNKPSRSFSPGVTRPLNTAFQISSTKDALVFYGVNVTCVSTLSGGQTGTVTLQYADDSAFTTNVTTAFSAQANNTVSLAIAVTVTQGQTVTLGTTVPAGKWVKIITANTTGTPTFAYQSGSETLQA